MEYCSKVYFVSLEAANERLAIIHIEANEKLESKYPVRAYKCPNCKLWHLTSEGKPKDIKIENKHREKVFIRENAKYYMKRFEMDKPDKIKIRKMK